MKGIRVVITEKHATDMVLDCYENFPEASISLDCVSWRYGRGGHKFLFKFVDRETGAEHIVTMALAIAGFHVFVNKVLAGELPGLHLGPKWLTDAGAWDGDCFDALLQCAIFHDVIYG